MKSSKRLPRLIVRLVCFASASMVLWPVLPWARAPRFFAQASPFAAICSSIALRSIGAGAVIGLAIAAVTVFRRRWFCGYLCPAGFLLECTEKIGFRKSSWWTNLPQLGKYIAVLTALGSVVGYPFLLWMDPLAVFSSIFSVRTAGTLGAGVLAGLIFGILVLLSFTSGPVWCARVCPLGGTQEILASIGSLRKGPRNGEPDEPEPAPSMGTGGLARRALIVGAAGIGVGILARRLGAAWGEKAPLRPPGAVEEESFAGLCIRCGNCVRSCPSKIIYPDLGQAGLAGLLAPVIRYDKEYCDEDCCACTKVCPSGALREMGLEQKRRYVIGEALVDGSLCLVTLGRKECDACARACPFDAVSIHWDDGQYVAYPMIDTKKCNGCGACEVACPTEDIKAIRVWRTGGN